MWLLWLVLALISVIGLFVVASILNEEQPTTGGPWPLIFLFILAIAFLVSLALFADATSSNQTGPESTMHLFGFSLNGAMVGNIVLGLFAVFALVNYPWEFLAGGAVGFVIAVVTLPILWLFGDVHSIGDAVNLLVWGTGILAIMIPLVKWKNGRPPNDHFGL